MIKTKPKAYRFFPTLAIVTSTIIGTLTALCAFLSITARLGYDLHGHSVGASGSFLFSALLILSFVWMVGESYGLYLLFGKAFRSIMGCDIYECGAKDYADGFYIMPRNGQTREDNLSKLKTNGPAKITPGAYTIYLELSYRQLNVAIYHMQRQPRAAYYELSRVYLMPDDISCLSYPKFTLRAALQAKRAMCADETVFFIYHVDYPEHLIQRARKNHSGEVAVIKATDPYC